MEYEFRNTMTRFLQVITVLGLLAGTLWAQGGTGELTGLVTDPSGAVVANAQITLTNTATGEKRTTVTTPAGTYRFRRCQWSEPTPWKQLPKASRERRSPTSLPVSAQSSAKTYTSNSDQDLSR